MKHSGIWVALALICMAGIGAAGYWLGMKQGAQQAPVAAPIKAERKILYYRNPMGLPDTSPTPKKDAMGMDYIPVYEDEARDSGAKDQIRISTEKVQKLGVRTEVAAMRDLSRVVRAVGRFQLDERRIVSVTAKFDGYIEKLFVNATGQPVRRGQPLMEIYSPELVSAQEEYLIAWRGRQSLAQGTEEAQSGIGQLAESALKRLHNWDISEAQLQRLQQEGKSTRTLTLYSPAGGVVLEKAALQGMRFMAGESLFKIADLSTIWLIADVFEQDLAQVAVGQKVNIRVDAYPDREFSGRVAYLYPTVNPETRTAQVRIELTNPGGILRPDMYANVELATGAGKAAVLTVSDSAVIDSGVRQIVLVQVADGLFEPREVKLGRRGNGYVEIMSGVMDGENVVVRANFLIDAESNLKAAIGGLSHSGHGSTPKQENPAPSAEHAGHPQPEPAAANPHAGH
jgi:Cu(I)/Ag(I) efflux system membrane fusion protein